MAHRPLIPFGWGRSALPSTRAETDPFLALHREMDRLFDQFSRGIFNWPAPTFTGEQAIISPQIDISESDDKLLVRAELPGMDQKDVQVELANNVLTVKGEKKEEREEKKAEYHLRERSFGSFVRSIPLPFEADPNKVEASFAKGVLTVAIPKPTEAQQVTRRIEVKGGEQAGEAEQAGTSQGG